MKYKWLRKILGGLSFTTALFVFQACYGTPQDLKMDFLIEGQVKSLKSGSPIEGIKVMVADNQQFQLTNSEGKFSFYTMRLKGMTLQFQDIDSVQNRHYKNKDTILNEVIDMVYIDIALEEK